MNQWIKTEIDHPEPLIDVLVVLDFDGDPYIDMGFWHTTGWFLTGTNEPVPIKPTHWMHLPELPT